MPILKYKQKAKGKAAELASQYNIKYSQDGKTFTIHSKSENDYPGESEDLAAVGSFLARLSPKKRATTKEFEKLASKVLSDNKADRNFSDKNTNIGDKSKDNEPTGNKSNNSSINVKNNNASKNKANNGEESNNDEGVKNKSNASNNVENIDAADVTANNKYNKPLPYMPVYGGPVLGEKVDDIVSMTPNSGFRYLYGPVSSKTNHLPWNPWNPFGAQIYGAKLLFNKTYTSKNPPYSPYSPFDAFIKSLSKLTE